MTTSARPATLEIHIDTSARCRVISGPERRVFYTTPQLAGLALLQQQQTDPADPVTATPASNITWSDNLRTHGIAHGVRGDRRYIVAVLPSRERTVSYRGRDDSTEQRLTATFPPILVALAFGRDNFQRGLVYIVNPAALSRLTVALNEAIATSFPYGNVYNVSGRICWGTVRHGHIRDLAGFEDLFFNSSFNSDLYHGPHGGLAGAIRVGNGTLAAPTSPGSYTMTMPGILAQLTATT